MHRALIIAALTLAGCASNPGIVPAGGDTMRLARSGYAVGASQSDVLSLIMKEAAEHCAAAGKTMSIVSSESRPGWPGHFPEAEIRFSCTAK